MQPQQQQIKLEQTTEVKCKCGNETFEQVFFLRQVPALLSPTLRAEIFHVPAFRCMRCKNIADLNPKKPEKTQ